MTISQIDIRVGPWRRRVDGEVYGKCCHAESLQRDQYAPIAEPCSAPVPTTQTREALLTGRMDWDKIDKINGMTRKEFRVGTFQRFRAFVRSLLTGMWPI